MYEGPIAGFRDPEVREAELGLLMAAAGTGRRVTPPGRRGA